MYISDTYLRDWQRVRYTKRERERESEASVRATISCILQLLPEG